MMTTIFKNHIAAILLVLGTMFSSSLLAQHEASPRPQSGRIERMPHFPSKHVDNRHVDVWLPDNFDALQAAGQRFNVIYMHDGQMLFDAAITWNKQAWRVDKTITSLVASGKISPTIVVGIWNNGSYRSSEYFPQKFLQNIQPGHRQLFTAQRLLNKPQSDAYLRFLVDELKPVIDKRYPTYADPKNNVLMGSSMGGLISIYAMNEYPNVFGGAAGLSTHWIGSFDHNFHVPLAAYIYLRDHLAAPQTHKIYQDHGTTELDALYAQYQYFVNQIIRDRGYQESGLTANFMTRVFEGAGHNENAWAARLEIPILFLLGQ
jgi:enterochelin esterase-like enzyme